MKKIKILYIISSFVKQGPNIVLKNLVDALDRDLFEIHILTFKIEGVNSIIREFAGKSDVTLHNHLLSNWRDIKLINKKVKDINPAIVHSHGFMADFINCISVKFGQVKVTTLHSCIYTDYYFEYKLKGFIAAVIHNIILFRFNVVCACSESVQSYIKNRLVKSIVVRNGVPKRFLSNNRIEVDYRVNKAKEAGKNILIFVGRLMKRKNLAYMIDSFINSARLKDSILVLVGNGPDENQLMQQYKNYNDSVIFTGFSNEPLNYITIADYFLLVSKAEGLPMVVLESLSVGTPVILSNIEPHREIFQLSENKIGYMLNEKNNNLNDVLDNVLFANVDLENNCKASFEKNFSAEIMAKNYQKIYMDCIKC